MANFEETPEEQAISKKGKAALAEGLVRAVYTSDPAGSTGGRARLIVVKAEVKDADLNKLETRGAILTPDGQIVNWLPVVAFPKWGDWYPIKGGGAAEKKKSGPPKKRWG